MKRSDMTPDPLPSRHIRALTTSRALPLALVALATLLSGCEPVVVGSAAATGVAVVHDRRTSGTVLDDQMIELKALDAISNGFKGVEGVHINVTAYNNIVLMTGETPDEATRTKAEEMIRAFEKVRRVHNEIAVQGASDLLSRGNDAWITTQVKTSLFNVKQESFDPTRVKVVTERSVVYLLGLVTHAEDAEAVEQARRVKGAARVVKIFEYLD